MNSADLKQGQAPCGECEIVLDYEVLSGSTLDGRLSTPRGARIAVDSLVNISRIHIRSSKTQATPSAAAAKAKKSVVSDNPFDLLGDDE